MALFVQAFIWGFALIAGLLCGLALFAIVLVAGLLLWDQYQVHRPRRPRRAPDNDVADRLLRQAFPEGVPAL